MEFSLCADQRELKEATAAFARGKIDWAWLAGHGA
jgi:hypothetical protein